MENEFNDSIRVKQKLLGSAEKILIEMADCIHQCFRNGGKLLILGNGGSAADAQHIAGELVGRFHMDRTAFPCIALTTDSSVLTAVANDFGYDQVFARQIQALASPGDVVLTISTSGNSPNVLEAMTVARAKGVKILALGGRGGGRMADRADLALIVPSDNAQRIQEAHILLAHTLCLLLEELYKTERAPGP
ncbi:SIS domain-containing protein [bacterium]|nr:SIS domain-containing protein [bacterium]